MLDGKDLCAAQIAFDGGTPPLFGWISLEPSRPGKQKWGGRLALPREVQALPDGKLGTRLPAKLVKTFELLPWQSKLRESSRYAAEFTLTLPTGDDEVRVSLAPLGDIVFQRHQIRILDATGKCWSELPAILTLKAIRIRIFVDADMVEVFADDRHSLTSRLPAKPGPVRLSAPASSVTTARFAEWRFPK